MPAQRSDSSAPTPSPTRTQRTRLCTRLGSSRGRSSGQRILPTRSPRDSVDQIHSHSDLGVQTSGVDAVHDHDHALKLGRSHLVLEIEALQHRKDLLSAEVRILEMTKEKDCLKADLGGLQSKYQAVADARDHALQCRKCNRVCQEPMIIQECTHGFCFQCLRTAFKGKVYKQLKELDVGELAHLRQPPYTSETLQKFCDAGHLVYVNWSCPTCDTYLWRRPRSVAFLNQLIAELSEVLGPSENLAANAPSGDDSWEGILFGMSD